MMKGRILSRIAVIAIFTAFSATLEAQVLNSLVRTGDVASAAVSGASVAMDATAFAVDNNAAAMVLSSGTMSAGASYSVIQPSAVKMNLASAAGFYKISPKLAIGADMKFLSYDPYQVVAADGRAQDSFTPNEIAVTAGAAYSLFDGFSVGAAAKFAMMSLSPEAKANAFGIDVSAMYSAGALTAGLNAKNIGSEMMDIRAGAAYKLSFLKAYAQGEFLSGAGVMAALGAEYSFKDMVFARAGFHYGGETAIPTSFSVGAGVKFAGINADVCFILANKAVGNSLSFGLGYSF